MRVVAYFASPDAAARAAAELERARWRTVAIGSPAFDEQLVESAGTTRSPVAASALAGGVLGAIAGLVLTIGTVREWPGLIVGGKPLVSMPPFLIITFELAILGASIFAVGSFLWAAARARRGARDAADRTTTDDRFSLLLEGPHGGDDAERLLVRLGAVEWKQL